MAIARIEAGGKVTAAGQLLGWRLSAARTRRRPGFRPGLYLGMWRGNFPY
jgi:hypothetical protein